MDVAQLMSGNITSVRKLEGFLTRVISESVTRNESITPEMISGLLGQETENQNNKRVVKPKEVTKTILSYYNLKTADITGDKRDKTIVVPRQILMYILRNDLKLPLMDIGKTLGGRDHTTVMHGVDKITKLLPESEVLRVDIARIRKQLYG
jgi:chromosomal replication initiator protein